ncbi:NUDIX hydrolase [bacterium]|nr:NUDIX hydrolase [bacterium]
MKKAVNPWKKLSSQTIYKNQWISLREDQVIRPDGEKGIYGVLETRIATGVVAIDTENYIYLVGQYRYPTDCYSWEIPEGGGDPGEAPLTTIQRELKEETSLVASDWVQLGPEVHLSNCISSERAYLFLARGLTVIPTKNPDTTEILEVKRVTFQTALQMARSGEIVDAISIIALERAANFLGLR